MYDATREKSKYSKHIAKQTIICAVFSSLHMACKLKFQKAKSFVLNKGLLLSFDELSVMPDIQVCVGGSIITVCHIYLNYQF